MHSGRDECSSLHPDIGLEWFEQQIPAAGWTLAERRVLALALYATLASPASPAQAVEITAAAAALADPDLVLEMAGVVFTFNGINRIADARRVSLEYRWLRDLWPIQALVERVFSCLTGLVYELGYVHKAGHTPDEVLGGFDAFSRECGFVGAPALFGWLRFQPAVLEGVTTLLLVNARDAEVSRDLWIQAAAVAVASRSTPGSTLRPMIDAWLARSSLGDCNTLLPRALPGDAPADQENLCVKYAWRVANAAHTIKDDDLRSLGEAGFSDPEVLDLTIAASLFAALSAIEPLAGVAVARASA